MLHQEMKYLLEIITSNVKILLLLWFMLNYTCRTDGLRIRLLIICVMKHHSLTKTMLLIMIFIFY